MALSPGSRRRIYKDDPRSNKTGPRAVDPHSPWQLLVEKQRKELKLSMRKLATRAQVSDGSLFNWLRNAAGGPTRMSYSANTNRRFAVALGLKPEILAEAYNESLFTPVDPDAIEEPPRPAPHPSKELPAGFSVDGLRRFLAMAEACGKATFTLADLKLIAAMIATSPDSQAT